MEKIINKNVLDSYIDALIKRCSFLYGIPYKDKLKKRLFNISSVIISDELSQTLVMDFSPYKRSIRINEKMISKDKYNNYILDFNKSSNFFRHSLIHELLHAASSRNDINGIITSGDNSYKTALNEGITQMIADDLCGYYENKFLGSYNIEKIIALILRESLSNEVILESYFINPNILENKINNLAKSTTYYTSLNIELTRYSSCKDNTKSERLDNLLKSVTLNVILPTYNSLDEKNRVKYLAKLLHSISGDELIKNKIKDYINKYINYSKKQVLDEGILIINKTMELESISDTMNDVEKNLKKILVLNDGSITILGDKRTKITSKNYKEKIYTKLFELNGYNKYLTNNVIEQYIDCIKKGKPLRLSQDNILNKRIMFCGIKKCLFDNGIYILNDYEELDKKDNIKLEFINKELDYNDYKKICNNFSICKNVGKGHKYSYSIIYNSTKNEVEDETIKKIAFYANNWLLCVQNNGREGINEAFSQTNKHLFNDVLDKLCYIMENMDNFNIKLIESLFKDKSLIRKLLKTPIQLEWVYDYIKSVSKKGPFKEKKGISYIESINKNYLIHRSNNEAQEIISKNK